MANLKISELPDAVLPVQDTDVIPIVQTIQGDLTTNQLPLNKYVKNAIEEYLEDVKKKDIAVRFIDHEGLIETQYFDRGESVTQFPTPKVYEDITFDEWTHTLAELENLQHSMVVGAVYRSTDGSTILDIRLNAVTELTTTIILSERAGIFPGIQIDWGDGTVESTNWNRFFSHTYSAVGSYRIKIFVWNGFLPGFVFESHKHSLTRAIIGNSTNLSVIDRTFSGCINLQSIVIPNSVISIIEGAFIDCHSLTNVIIPNSVRSIENDTFIPDVISIENNAFASCTSLTNVVIGKNAVNIGENAFGWCTSLTSITIGNSVRSIGHVAFSQCNSLTEIVIPNSVTSIGRSAFSRCTNLTKVTIGNSVRSIGYSAFGRCYNLLEYVFESRTPPMITISTFSEINAFTKIYVPNSSVDIYKAATNWVALEKHIFPISARPAGRLIQKFKDSEIVETEIETINKTEIEVITASEGKEFKRKANGFLMGSKIYLGICTLTGEKDVLENYEEVDIVEVKEGLKIAEL